MLENDPEHSKFVAPYFWLDLNSFVPEEASTKPSLRRYFAKVWLCWACVGV
jgi:hypothetical protein